MGNQFIGFPVPRAKIADMIATDAPPKVHHTDHETGGDDEVDCTGLAGAGGISLPFDDFYYHTLFESLPVFHEYKKNNGNWFHGYSNIYLFADIATDDTVWVKKEPSKPFVDLTWSKAREFKSHALLVSDSPYSHSFFIGTGDICGVTGFGFVCLNGGIKARTINGGSFTDTLIESPDLTTWACYRKLRAVFTPGVDVKFYVGGALVATHTTNLPTGSSGANQIIFLRLDSPAAGSECYLYLAEWHLWQAA